MSTFRKRETVTAPDTGLSVPAAVIEALAEPDPVKPDFLADHVKVIAVDIPRPATSPPKPPRGRSYSRCPELPPEVEEAALRAAPKKTSALPAEIRTATPYNRTTGAKYQGANILRLLTAEAENGWETSPGWAGFHQWKAYGRIVSKGEHGTRCLTVIKTDDKTNVRGFVVFHFAQTEPLEQKEVTQ